MRARAFSNLRVTLVQSMTDRRGELNATTETGWAAIHYASSGSKDQILDLLLETDGIDVHATTPEGRTALHLACNYQAESTARLLMEAGAKLTAKDSKGKTPADLAGERDKALRRRLEKSLRKSKSPVPSKSYY